MQTLEPNDPFPAIEGDAVDGSHFRVPDELEGVWSVLIFYRGHF